MFVPKVIGIIFKIIAYFFASIFGLTYFLLAEIFPENESRIIQTYSISQDERILVDNWDCGATCPSQIKVIKETINHTNTKRKILFSCINVFNIEFSNISNNYAVIKEIVGDESNCPYKEGDVLKF